MSDLNFEQVVKLLNKNGFLVVHQDDSGRFDSYLDRTEFRYVLWLDRIYEKIRRVPGHILEVGVARGRNAILFGHLIRMNGEEDVRHYYGFDTFDGYTEQDLANEPNLDANAWKQTSVEFVKGRLQALNLENIAHVYKADVHDGAKLFMTAEHAKFQPDKLRLALLYIDCNAYGAAKFTLDFFYEYMTPGGIICIDEKKQGGETQALIEFCKERGLKIERDPGPFGLPAYVQVPD